jgi:hypothetical protein
MIKIQFSPPGQREMACLAKVVRIEPLSNGMLLVGAEFFELTQVQKLFVSRGVAYKLVREWNELRQTSPLRFTWKWILFRLSKRKKLTLFLTVALALWLTVLLILIFSV